MTTAAGAGLASQQVVYLGISGVLHPSETTYNLVMRRSPWDDGHAVYEGVPILAEALQRYPLARIVLTSILPWAYGLPSVLEKLGPLVPRVDGFTFDDLTKRVERLVKTRSGTMRRVGFSQEDYWRMNKSHIVLAHVAWLRPQAWVAIDDEDILWPTAVARAKLVVTDGCAGLRDAATMDRLLTMLEGNFGSEVLARPTVDQHVDPWRFRPDG